MTQTDEFGQHEVVHTASIIVGMISDHLMEHGAVEANPKWKALVSKAFDAMFEVYQVIAADTMCGRTLKDIIREKTYRKGEFTLSSGQTSNYFFDLKPTMLDPAGSNLIADAIIQKLTELRETNYQFGDGKTITAIAGIALGGVPIISVVCARSYYQYGLCVPAVIIRKETKDHGTKKLIEGDELKPGSRVVLIEDVTNTGASAKVGIDALTDAGCIVEDVITVIDRLEGAKENLAAMGITLHSLFTRADFG